MMAGALTLPRKRQAIYEDVRVVDPPELGWGSANPGQPELPHGYSPAEYRNEPPCDLELGRMPSQAPFELHNAMIS
jgi:hypothetical protein